ncbi:filamentous hemagglutinin N-terminal domain-containing protein [Scytonema sp. NUACC26]|uniref:two-partner secretion domain-containing protein n=1 Tax=Scytonema sp. NUACC26 TaxID=3140176 RepID=UPI0034DC02B2
MHLKLLQTTNDKGQRTTGIAFSKRLRRSIAYSRCASLIAQALTCQFASAIVLCANCAIAQITPDATLPNNSNVKLEGNTTIIEGGTQAGSNLFHSFSEFSVPTNSTALFNNKADIQNIISRVTGNSISNIDGLIRSLGTANLFLINPNGVIFGENARVNIGGSFFATSANSMKFADGLEFSAKNPQPTPLLTINVPVGLQFGANPGLIQVRGDGRGARGFNSPIIDTQDALRVQPARTLALVGGEINLEGATLKTAGGRIELGSVAGSNLVSLTPTNFGFALGYGGVQNFGNIQLSQRAIVDASGEGGGEIQVQGRRVTVTNGSRIETSTLGAKQGGDLVVNATESVAIGQFSGLSTVVYPKATGNAGNLTINTRELLVRDGAQVIAVTFGAGKGGNLAVTADRVQAIGRGSNFFALAQGTGNAGNLTINTRELLIRDGAQVGAATLGAGKGGNLAVTADSVQVIGRQGSFSTLVTETQGTGNAGDLTINTRELLIRDGAKVGAGTFGTGKGGNLAVTADRIQVIGTAGGSSSALSNQTEGTGNAGDLTINTRELLIRDGAFVSAGTFGTGNGGNLAVTADRVQVIGTSTDGRASNLNAQANRRASGDAGDLTINTRELLVQDGAIVSASTSGAGKGGNLDIQARELLIRGGAQVGAGTFGAGKGGNLAVTADSVQVVGISADERVASALSTQTEGTGNAGNLTINTRELRIRDGAFISTGTRGAGEGGNLAVTANSVQVIGRSNNGRFSSFLSAQAEGTGNAGDLTINTRELLVQDGASVSASTIGGKGKAGDITVDANSILLDNATEINANTTGGGGNIFLNSPLLLLRRGSSITTNASGDNITGGSITIDAKNGFIIALANENSDIRADSENFRGGNITINNAAGIFGIQPRNVPSSQTSDITAKGATPELSGRLQINSLDIDPRRGLVPLTIDVVDVASLVDENICAQTANSSFTYIGRGGLPPSPNNTLNSDAVWEDWRLVAVPWGRGDEGEQGSRGTGERGNNFSRPTQIVEAQGWIIDKNGEVTLTAYAPVATPHKVGSSSHGCQPPIAK